MGPYSLSTTGKYRLSGSRFCRHIPFIGNMADRILCNLVDEFCSDLNLPSYGNWAYIKDSLLLLPRVRLELGRKTLSYFAPNAYNLVPANLKESLNFDTIKWLSNERKNQNQGRIYKFGAPRPTDQRAPPPEDSDYTDVEIQ
ncbi:hypothetical protein J6590_013857 [Homalodisca vitripennis]|nr:hypothetical protein J6590_013857 [Homalodisca vitripennis]